MDISENKIQTCSSVSDSDVDSFWFVRLIHRESTFFVKILKIVHLKVNLLNVTSLFILFQIYQTVHAL